MMSSKGKLLISEERGTATVLVALSLVVLMGMAALVMDGGSLYVTKSKLQKTANAAALSGAQELTQTEASVNNVVSTVVHEHHEDGNLTSTTVEMGKKVVVQLRKEVPFGLAKVLGYASAPVEAKATAEISVMGSAIGAAPLGIDESVSLVYGQEYTLKVDQTESVSGYFGILQMGGSGADVYGNNLMKGYQGELKMGDILDTESGNKVGKTREGVDYRLHLCPYIAGDMTHRDCPRIILVPVYKPYNDTKNQLKQVEIRGFAYFYLSEPVDEQQKTVKGKFIQRAGSGFTNPTAANKGAFAIRLTE
jgi:hypothetical protein